MSDPYSPGTDFRLRSSYGIRRDPMTGAKGRFHSGQDFAASQGTPIPAAMAGVVVYSGFNENLGNTVIVRNGAGEYNLYAHMKDGAPQAQTGQKVWPGDILGQVGSTGARTTGPHLHYSVIKKEMPNPLAPPGQRDRVPIIIRQTDPKGGQIGVNLNKVTTIDPATYDVAPYLDQTLRAEQMLAPGTSSGVPIANSASAASKPAPLTGGSPVSDPGNSFNDRFGNWQALTPDGSVNSPALEVLPGGLPGLIADHLRRQQQSGSADSPAPAAQSDKVNSSDDDPATFDERFRAAAPIRRLSSPIDALMWR